MSKRPIQEGCPPLNICYSEKRFATEFSLDDNSELGKGKFGHVFRARNKIDKREYAVKKIRLRDIDSEDGSSWDEAQKEVERLSKLKHEYIVRYQTAWYEQVFIDDGLGTQSPSDLVKLTPDSGESNGKFQPMEVGPAISASGGSMGSEFSSVEHSESQGMVVSVHSPSISSNFIRDMANVNRYDDSSARYSAFTGHRKDENMIDLREADEGGLKSRSKDVEGQESKAKKLKLNLVENVEKTYLYIQMELCHMTLHKWILLRNLQITGEHSEQEESVTKEILNILREEWVEYYEAGRKIEEDQRYLYIKGAPTNNLLEGIVKGLKYLHGEQVAHQDLHLGNVLIVIDDREKVTPRISDFGLAKTIDPSSMKKLCETEYRVSPVGKKKTALRTDTCSHALQCKNDMVKLAKIIMKLFCYPSDSNVAEFEKKWPIQAGLIRDLKNQDYQARPSATTILRIGKEERIFEFKDQDEIRQLKEIEELQMKIMELQEKNLLLQSRASEKCS